MVKILFSVFILFSLSNLYSCSPSGVLASGGATTMVVAEGDRSLGTVVDDATIKLNIASKFIGSDNNLFLNIDSKVIQGRVLLTGIVEDQEIRIEAGGLDRHLRFVRLPDKIENRHVVLERDIELESKRDNPIYVCVFHNYDLRNLLNISNCWTMLSFY